MAVASCQHVTSVPNRPAILWWKVVHWGAEDDVTLQTTEGRGPKTSLQATTGLGPWRTGGGWGGLSSEVKECGL